MKSVLKELKSKFYLIMKTNRDELTNGIILNDDLKTALESLMQIINPVYTKNINPEKQIRIFLKKTSAGKCYLKVIGRDRNTTLIIKPNDAKFSEYSGIIGYKISESKLAETLDLVQRTKLEKAGIAKRFIKEEIPPVDLYEEMGIENFVNHCVDIYAQKNEPKFVGFYEEPENKTGRTKKTKINSGTTQERLNPIIPYEIRKQELVKHHQKEIIRFKGIKSNNVFDAYIYIRHGYILAIVEPISGLGYQYNLNLGFADDYNEESIKEMIRATLEAEENLVMIDDAIIRKNHTTIENFKDNIGIFLNNKDYNKNFATKTENAAKVYQRVKKI